MRRFKAAAVRALLSFSCSFLLLTAAYSRADEPVARPFDIRAQSLATALNEFARQSEREILFAPDIVAKKRSSALRGNLEPLAALQLLLKDSGLSFRTTPNGAILVGTSSGSALSPPDAEGNDEAPGETPVRDRLHLAQVEQQTSGVNTSVDAREGSATSRPQLQEIVVTATKRVERAQDIPMSISVIGNADIRQRGLVGAEDALRGIPGVNQGSSVSGSSVVIRGVETSPVLQNFSSGSTVATYFGETATTSSGGLANNGSVDIKLVDIDRVEVLRGPQGTAFGDSSLGGAVRTIPVAPVLDSFEGRAGFGFSNTSHAGSANYTVQAVGNVPVISDRFAIRAVGYGYSDDGFYRNVATTDAPFLSTLATYGPEGQTFARDSDGVGKSTFTGGRVAALFKAHENLDLTFTYLKQSTETDGFPATNVGDGYDQVSLQVAPEHHLRGQKYGASDTSIDLANLAADYDLGWANLIATYSYIQSGSDLVRPYSIFANTPEQFGYALPLSQQATSDHTERAGEVRLVSKLTGAWNFLGGLYYQKADDGTFFGYVWHSDPQLSPFGGGRYPGSQRDYDDQRELKQRAVFGEVSWQLMPGLTLTGGGRAYKYDRRVDVVTQGTLFGDSAESNSTSKSGSSFKGSLSYKLNESALVYASWSQGFRLGKPQPGLLAGLCDVNNDAIVDGTNVTLASTRNVNSDTVTSFELGNKLTLMDRRLQLSAAVFRINWSGMPFLTTLDNAQCRADYVANAGRARSDGVESQVSFQINEAWRVDAGGSYIDAHLTEAVPAQGLLADARLPGSPRLNANVGAQFQFDFLGREAFVRADSIYVGTFSSALPYSAGTEAGGYTKLDLKAGAQFGKLRASLFVLNATDADEYTFRNNADVAGYRLRPRTVGVELGYEF